MNEFDDIFTSVQTEPEPAPEEPFDLDAWKEKKQTDRQQVYDMADDTTIGVCLSSRRNYRRREEHGSAKWGDARSIVKRYQARRFEDNKLLTQNFRMGLDGRKHRRNLNTLKWHL